MSASTSATAESPYTGQAQISVIQWALSDPLLNFVRQKLVESKERREAALKPRTIFCST